MIHSDINMLDLDGILNWTEWLPHNGCWRGNGIPTEPGLYRLRRVGQTHLDYIGQTGSGTMGLRKRLAMQSGAYADEMPYTDPHTAAPALWALRQSTAAEYEVSVVPVVGSTQWRKGLEALAQALHRQEFGRSPTVNFGRMPVWFHKSSGNNQKLVLAGKRFRGGKCDTTESHHAPGVPPVGPLTGDPQAPDWCGHRWSGWISIASGTSYSDPAAQGMYRIRDAGKPGLIYIGEGIVAARLIAHLRKARTPDHAQGSLFQGAERLECSWVPNDSWLSHQRLELECDLIGAHLLVLGVVPPAQFIG